MMFYVQIFSLSHRYLDSRVDVGAQPVWQKKITSVFSALNCMSHSDLDYQIMG